MMLATQPAMSPIQSPLSFQAKMKKRNVKNLALGSASIKPLTASLYAKLSEADIMCESPLWHKTRSTIYSNGPIEVLPNLYLGDENNASNPEVLSKLNIGFVLNVAREVENKLLDNHGISSWQMIPSVKGSLFLKKHTFPTLSTRPLFSKKLHWDHNQENIMDFFESAFNFIDFARSLNVGILIHCQCGVSRSASLMIAYVMKALNIPFDSSYQFVKAKSSAVSPNLSLISQLVEFEKTLKVINPLFPLNSSKHSIYPSTPGLVSKRLF